MHSSVVSRFFLVDRRMARFLRSRLLASTPKFGDVMLLCGCARTDMCYWAYYNLTCCYAALCRSALCLWANYNLPGC